jgi:hypothetical protein
MGRFILLLSYLFKILPGMFQKFSDNAVIHALNAKGKDEY